LILLQFVIDVDDKNGDNQGDLIMAVDLASPEPNCIHVKKWFHGHLSGHEGR
jgi:hypothetical protein